ncbi:hypothetical protein TNCV_570111 [Trichonephila clavipes]|nr:hypothetical protein TNCV_570111 [Trichonephila clavipes]
MLGWFPIDVILELQDDYWCSFSNYDYVTSFTWVSLFTEITYYYFRSSEAMTYRRKARSSRRPCEPEDKDNKRFHADDAMEQRDIVTLYADGSILDRSLTSVYSRVSRRVF